MDFGQPAIEWIGPFQVVSTFRPDEGIPGVRFFYPRLAKIVRALFRARADLYYVRCAGFILAPVVCVAKLLKKKVVFCGASNVDFDPGSVELKGTRDKVLYFWGLRNCDAVVVQNEAQQKSVFENFHRRAPIIRNGFVSEVLTTPNSMQRPKEFLIWVGSFRKYKKRVPRGAFVMIGGSSSLSSPEEWKLWRKIVCKSEAVSNLNLTGPLPFEEVEEYFHQSKILINTSDYEGFPNTFLQAWSKGIPVVSFVDPDNLLASNGLGMAVKDMDEMVRAVDSVLDSSTRFSPEKIKAYFEDHFLIKGVGDQYESLFRSISLYSG
jgi:glycosyltransferase involved in cell wall biosynthesis